MSGTVETKRRPPRWPIVPAMILLVTTMSGCAALEDPLSRIWSVRGSSSMHMAEDAREKGRIQEAEMWWRWAVYFTITDTINREIAYGDMRQVDDLIQQGKLIDALNLCYVAARIYNEEGVITYHCLQIEQQIYGTPTPVQ